MTVGFDRYIRTAWLDAALALAAAGAGAEQARRHLDESLKDEISGGTSREKTVRRLAQIWIEPRPELMTLRDGGLRLNRSGLESKVPLHWGMCMAGYPFFGTVAEAIGRQLRLQGTCHTSLVYRRNSDVYGQRPTVKDATERVLQSMKDWGALDRVEEGLYAVGDIDFTNSEMSAWLTAASFHAWSVKSRPVDAVIQDPVFFPFQLSLFEQDDISARQLQLLRQGERQDVALLVSQ